MCNLVTDILLLRLGRFIRLFFFNKKPTTELYTLSLHDALPISALPRAARRPRPGDPRERVPLRLGVRSEEHTSELQSLTNLVCRLLLEKKNELMRIRISSVDTLGDWVLVNRR